MTNEEVKNLTDEEVTALVADVKILNGCILTREPKPDEAYYFCENDDCGRGFPEGECDADESGELLCPHCNTPTLDYRGTCSEYFDEEGDEESEEGDEEE